jgi:hypothetical protein
MTDTPDTTDTIVEKIKARLKDPKTHRTPAIRHHMELVLASGGDRTAGRGSLFSRARANLTEDNG